MQFKQLKSEVDYKRGTPEEHCGICTHFRPPEACKKVAGVIKRVEWCQLFERKR